MSQTKETPEFRNWAEDRTSPPEAVIDFSKDETYRKFKLAYHDALKLPSQKVFIFEGHEILVQYGKYLIQYVEGHRKACRLKFFDPAKRMWKINYPKEVVSP